MSVFSIFSGPGVGNPDTGQSQLPSWAPQPNRQTEAQGGSLQSNVSNIPQIQQLTELINGINQSAQKAANAGRIPGGAGLEEQSSGNIGNALAGKLDPSVIQRLGQAAAERGVSSGSPMGAGSNADYLRSLGLTSLDLQNTGQSWLTQAEGRNPAAPVFDPTHLLITPFQQAQIDLENEKLRIARLEAARRYSGTGHPTGGYGGGSVTAGTAGSGASLIRPVAPTYSGGGVGGGGGVPLADLWNEWDNTPWSGQNPQLQGDYDNSDVFANYA